MNKVSSIEVLRNLADQLNAEAKENSDSGYLSFDNSSGKGSIRAQRIFQGLEILTFDVLLNTPLNFDYINMGESYLHFLFIDEGFLKHQFQCSKNLEDAIRFQNVILGNRSEDFSEFKLPEDVKLCFLLITIEKCSNKTEAIRGKLPVLLDDVLDSLLVGDSYHYFGNVSNKTSNYVKAIIESVPDSLNNRLLIEACVLHTLYCQILDHDENKQNEIPRLNLSKSEIFSIIRISEYISQNLDKPLKLQTLERETVLSQKRIQYGFQHYFGMTVNKYIINLRILKARELIEKTDLSISEIVYSVGLSSRSYFSRIFSEKFGLLPIEYRRNFKISNPTYELCYYSKAIDNLRKSDFQTISEDYVKNTVQDGITGCLIYSKGYFLQILEGSKDRLRALRDTILSDTRHSEVETLYEGVKSGRTFDEWNMVFVEEPSLFSCTNPTNFKLLDIGIIPVMDMKSDNPKSNKLRAKLIWERVRNALLVKIEGQKVGMNDVLG